MFYFLFLVGSLITLSSSGPTAVVGSDQDGAPKAFLSASELRRRISIAQELIDSVSIIYRNDNYVSDDERAAGTYVHRIIAAKSPGSLLHWTAHGSRDMDWRLDFKAQRAIIASNRAFNISDVNRAFIEEQLPVEAPLPGSLPMEFYFHGTGVFPLRGRPAPKRFDDGVSPSVLRDVAVNREFNVVRPLLEQVDGRWCHVLERPGLDVLWIDVEHGCALLAREAFDSKSGALTFRFECGGHRELGPGIWLPMWIRYIQFDSHARTADLRQRRITDSRIEVLRSEVNSVDDRIFAFSPMDGALRLDARGDHHVQVRPRGLDHLDDLVSWTQKVLGPRWKLAGRRMDRGGLPMRDVYWGGLGLVFGGFIALLVRPAFVKGFHSLRSKIASKPVE
jgi:hypothetical protein